VTEYEQLRKAHPDRQIIVGEVGWATKMHNDGLQSELIKGQAGEVEQQQFFKALNEWSQSNQIVTFYFEAFDENWKGGAHPDEVEKHWGLYRADRSPKPAILQTPKNSAAQLK
jgi:exo-beta-1,3-glucanase (GH17 family)